MMTAPSDAFAGDKKFGRWLLADLERRFVVRAVPRVPRFLETHHLTLMTIPWTLAVVLCGWLAATQHPAWLLGSSAAIVLQYLTDLLDGAVGRARDTGLVRWGFHMDHLLDYVFLCGLWVGYSFLLPAAWMPLVMVVLGLSGALMVNGFLAFAATNEFRISHLGVGPTEIRLGFIALNAAILTLGAGILPGVLTALSLGLVGALTKIAHGTQRELWDLDMAAKAGRSE